MRCHILVAMALFSAQLASAADKCDGVLTVMRNGADSEVEWSSRAYKLSDDSYCYERTVKVSKRTFVDWPLANFNKAVLEGENTTRSCCYAGPRPEDAALEYGISPTRLSTKVVRGDGEPKPGETKVATFSESAWSTFEGLAVIDSRPTKIDFTYRMRRVGERLQIEVTNGGDEISFISHWGGEALGARIPGVYSTEILVNGKTSREYFIPKESDSKALRGLIPPYVVVGPLGSKVGMRVTLPGRLTERVTERNK